MENKDLQFIGEGGFAYVYLVKNKNIVLKKLKPEFLSNEGVKSRFKREFEITKELDDIDGIIKVYEFNYDDYSYTMEFANNTLEKYIKNNLLSEEDCIDIILQIISIFSKVHKRNVIHRDISPNNIFIMSNNKIKVADFGLGKDFTAFESHRTEYTSGLGQYLYCAPEQQSHLKNSDKRSDVYSLGKLINFILTKDPNNFENPLGVISKKATELDPNNRFRDSTELLNSLNEFIEFKNNQNNERKFWEDISKGNFNKATELYIHALSPERITYLVLNKGKPFSKALIKFMKVSEDNANLIMNSIYSNYEDICHGRFENYDPFGEFCCDVIKEKFPYLLKQTAAEILHVVAVEVNRYHIQDLVEKLRSDVDPTLIDIIDNGRNY